MKSCHKIEQKTFRKQYFYFLQNRKYYWWKTRTRPLFPNLVPEPLLFINFRYKNKLAGQKFVLVWYPQSRVHNICPGCRPINVPGTLGILDAREGHIFYFLFHEGLHNVCNKDKIGKICACLAPMVEENWNFP